MIAYVRDGDVVVRVKSPDTDRGVAVKPLSDGIGPSTREGRLLLNLMATFAEYERELIRERVHASIDAAKECKVRIGRPARDPDKVARNLCTVRHLIEAERLGVVEAARTVGRSKATCYRHRWPAA